MGILGTATVEYVSNGTIYVSMYINSIYYIFLNVEDGSKSYMHYEHKTFFFCGLSVECKSFFFFPQSESCICLRKRMKNGISLVIFTKIY